jgi:general secretion pathway protein A
MYQEHFGFRVLPFASAPDPSFFYLNPVYEAALAKLRYGVLGKKGIIVLTGAIGTGKTALLRKLFDDLGPSVKSIWVVNGGVSVLSVLSTTMAELNLNRGSAEPSAMIEALHGFLIQSANRKNITCLIIEEAQSLDSETLEGLKQLCNLEADSQKLLQLIFVGQPEFIKKLVEAEHQSLKQRVALHCRLFPLTRSELHRYIEFQLQVAGYHDERLFDAGAIARIAHYSGGIPRLVNCICDNALLAAYCSSRKEVSQELIDEVAKDMNLANYQQTSPPAPIDSVPVQSAIKAMPPKRRVPRMIGVALLSLIPLGAAGWAVRFKEAKPLVDYFKSQAESVKSGIEHLAVSAKGESISQISQQQRAMADDHSAPLDGGHAKVGAISEAVISAALELSDPAPETSSKKTQDIVPKPSRSMAKDRVVDGPVIRKRQTETEIQEAIHNRAIEGVSITFLDGTAYLDGQVASERQKFFAEQAALGVPEVARVENRIKIEP